MEDKANNDDDDDGDDGDGLMVAGLLMRPEKDEAKFLMNHATYYFHIAYHIS